jgi:Trk-type K+ transport system membrane component
VAGGQGAAAVAPGELLLTVVVGRPRREHTSVMLELQVGWGGGVVVIVVVV